eukprot:TRINITY_DN75669_c0_g1_i1.p1 TRINITY_DN75669_c0_g1~~TRINITY_DN75669_c0_g1_i1.p1  ORF type:complete len:701 (-),score=58.93 TRINITY_DN75669_c0_g1_i1:613-2715(-)
MPSRVLSCNAIAEAEYTGRNKEQGLAPPVSGAVIARPHCNPHVQTSTGCQHWDRSFQQLIYTHGTAPTLSKADSSAASATLASGCRHSGCSKFTVRGWSGSQVAFGSDDVLARQNYTAAVNAQSATHDLQHSMRRCLRSRSTVLELAGADDLEASSTYRSNFCHSEYSLQDRGLERQSGHPFARMLHNQTATCSWALRDATVGRRRSPPNSRRTPIQSEPDSFSSFAERQRPRRTASERRNATKQSAGASPHYSSQLHRSYSADISSIHRFSQEHSHARSRSLSTDRGSPLRLRNSLDLACPSLSLGPPTEAFVDVFLRIRPQNQREYASERSILVDGNDVHLDDGESVHTFQFKGIIDSDARLGCSDQAEVYSNVGKEAIESVLHGFNTCIFSLGQTGTGKSHTLIGTPDDPGLLPRLVSSLLQVPQQCQLSCVEIYMDCVTDLLAEHSGKRAASGSRCTPRHSVRIPDLQKVSVRDVDEAMRHINKASRNRRVARTAMNAVSSRGHVMYQLEFGKSVTLCVVDLAGRENERSTACRGEALGELIYINKSLFHLTSVLNALAQPKSRSLVPFRNSKLTMLLQKPLQQSRTLMIATVSPSAISSDETLTTLRLAQSVAKIRTRIRRHQSPARTSELSARKGYCDTARSSMTSSSQVSTADTARGGDRDSLRIQSPRLFTPPRRVSSTSLEFAKRASSLYS